MVTRALKVPPAFLLLGAVGLAACGGEARSEGDTESERLAAEQPAAEEARTDEAAPAVEAPASPPPAAQPAPPREPRRTAEAERVSPPPPLERTDREPAPAPDVAPAPAVAAPTVAVGTRIPLVIESELTTQRNSPGDVFFARVTEDVLGSGGLVLVSNGTRVKGRVTESRKSAGPDEEAILALSIEALVVDGRELPLRATVVEAQPETEARDSDTRTAAKVATGAAAGALVGQILGRDRSSTLKGAAAGAVAGTAVAVATRDGHATFKAGSQIVIRVDEPVVLAER